MSLHAVGDDIWLIEGPLVRSWGLVFPTRAVVLRLADGAVWIDSPVPVAPDTLAELRAWGPVRYLVAPTKLHVWRLAERKADYPGAELWAPPRVPKEFRTLGFAGVLTDQPPAAWSADLDQLVFRGNCLVQEVWFFHRRSRSLIVGDFIQNHEPQPAHRYMNLLVRLAGVAFPNPGVALDIRLSFTDRKAARQSLATALSWPFERLIVSHGACVFHAAREAVQQAFQWLA